MGALTLDQEHELIKSMVKLSPRAVSIMVSSMGMMQDKHCLHSTIGPRNFTFMPQGKNVIDMIDLYDPAERDYLPSVFSRPCDPAVPIELQNFELGTICSLRPGYIKRSHKVHICDEELEKIMLRELPNLPWNVSAMSDDEKISVQMFAAARQIQGETREASVRMFNHSIYYGGFYNGGPGIQSKHEFINLNKNPNQTCKLSGEGWGNTSAAIGKTIEQQVRLFYNESKQRCRARHIFFDERTAACIEENVEYQECAKCWAYDPNVVRRQEFFNRDQLPSDEVYGMRGIKQFPYSNSRLQGVNFWVCDELEKTEIYEDVTNPETGEVTQVGTGEYHLTPVMPEGTMLIIGDAEDIGSTALRGNIKSLRAQRESAPLDQWSQIVEKDDGECMELQFHTSPMDLATKVNCARVVYTVPTKCPPHCEVPTCECDPKGGKAAAEAANPFRAAFSAQTGGDSSAQIQELIARMEEQTAMISGLKAENENFANTLQAQAEDLSKLSVKEQVAEAAKTTAKNQSNKGSK